MLLRIALIGYYYKVGMLSNLGAILSLRYKRIRRVDDFNYMVNIANKAVAATPLNHPNYTTILKNLRNTLSTRFKRTRAIDNLNCAVNVINKAVAITPFNYPN